MGRMERSAGVSGDRRTGLPAPLELDVLKGDSGIRPRSTLEPTFCQAQPRPLLAINVSRGACACELPRVSSNPIWMIGRESPT